MATIAAVWMDEVEVPVEDAGARAPRTLTAADYETIGRELDALRTRVLSQVGEEDAAYIRTVVRVARGSAIAGRVLIGFGFTPISFGVGVAALSLAKILDNMEIGHNVLHGQYDWMDDPSLDSRTFEWDNVCDSAQWKHYHNYEHHTFTNVLGLDRDVGYGIMRIAEEQRWTLKHLFQPVSNVILSLLFQWGVGIHDMDPARVLLGGKDDAESRQRRAEFPAKWRRFLRKAGRQLGKDYVLFPLLTPWNAPRVLAANLLANGIRNVWSNVIIFCGHFPEGTKVFTREEIENETRGQWYVRQLLGSANIEGGRWLHILSGHLSHQIEHHLFPDIPARRYPEIAGEVRALCERYELPYNTGNLAEQYGSVLLRLVKNAIPPSLATAFAR
jgi:fatty acid desaturase